MGNPEYVVICVDPASAGECSRRLLRVLCCNLLWVQHCQSGGNDIAHLPNHKTTKMVYESRQEEVRHALHRREGCNSYHKGASR